MTDSNTPCHCINLHQGTMWECNCDLVDCNLHNSAMTDSTKKLSEKWCECGHLENDHFLYDGCRGCPCRLGMCDHPSPHKEVVICGTCKAVLPEMKSSALSSEPAKQTKLLTGMDLGSPDGDCTVKSVKCECGRVIVLETIYNKPSRLTESWKATVMRWYEAYSEHEKLLVLQTEYGMIEFIQDLLDKKDLEAQEKVEYAVFIENQRLRQEFNNPYEGVEKQIKVLAGIVQKNAATEDTRALATDLLVKHEDADRWKYTLQLQEQNRDLRERIRKHDKLVEEAVKTERMRCADVFRKYTEGQLHAYCNKPLYLGIIYDKILEPPKA